MSKIIRTKTKILGDITPDEKILLDEHSRLCIKRAMRTAPIEPDKIIPAIEGLYTSAGLERPRVIIVPSPLVMAFAYGAASVILNNSSHTTEDATRSATHDATYTATHAATYATFIDTYAATYAATVTATLAVHEATHATHDATHDATYTATHEATYTAAHEATYAAALDATYTATLAATYATYTATRAATYATYPATRAATRAVHEATFTTTRAAHGATYTATRAATHDATYTATHDAMSNVLSAATACFELAGKRGLEESKNWVNIYQSGNTWAGYDCYLTAMRDVLGLELPEHKKYMYWEQAAIHGGFRVMHEKFCIVSDFPEILKIDNQNRPHCDDGPSHRWRDGWSLYHWHGVKVPKEWIIDKEKLTPKTALSWQNIEQRRAACEIVGWDKILTELSGVTINKDDDPEIGELIKVTIENNEEHFLRVRCGTGRQFAIPVPLEMKTALQANAWTFGIEDVTKFIKPEIRT